MAVWTPPRTWTPGEFVTALMMNTHVRDNMINLNDRITAAELGVFTGRISTSGATTAANGIAIFRTDQAGEWRLFQGGDGTFYINYNSDSSAGLGLRVTSLGVVAVTGFGAHTFSAGGTGANEIKVRNTTAGAANFARFVVGNDITDVAGQFTAFSNSYTAGATWDVQNCVALQTTRGGGLSIAATDGSGTIRFYSGGTSERMRLDANGLFGIGTTPSYTLHVSKSVASNYVAAFSNLSTTPNGVLIQIPNAPNESYIGLHVQGYAGNSVVITYANGFVRLPTTYNNTTAAAANVNIDASGYLYRSTSSLRYKRDVKPIAAADFDAVKRLKPVTFRAKPRSKDDIDAMRYPGLIAEDVATVLPALVGFDDKARPDSVYYDRVAVYVLGFVQDLDKRVQKLEGKAA